METRDVICIFILLCAVNEVSLRSLDQIFEELEIANAEKDDSIISKFPSKVWFDYAMEGRTEELVKVQFDLVMTKEHWNKVTDTDNALPSRGRRNAVKGSMSLWPRKIPYKINEAFDIEDRLELIMAMDHWEEHTCLEFVEAKSHDSDYIEFVPDPSVCESLLGKMQGRQRINLAPPCMDKAVIVHEIGHALGLYHEHMRADRDDYVKVHYENINKDFHNQFDKLKQEHYDDYNKPYDYESIMHYGKLYYSRNRTENLLTIEPFNASYLDIIGEGLSLSFYDVQIVSDMYECSRGCVPKVCPGNGFLGKNCECYCPGKTSFDIVLCEEPDNCGNPDISLSNYLVFTNNYDTEIHEWKINSTYTHGTNFLVEHRNESCGARVETFNCTDGQWEGELPPCEKPCKVDEYSDVYLVRKASLEVAKPGEMVTSLGEILVSCSDGRKIDGMDEQYILCSDGFWFSKISDIDCKGHALCTMVLDAQLNGTLEDGFTVTCSPGYELETQGGPGNKFMCSWEGRWEPTVPVCKPAKCRIPVRHNAKFYKTNDDELVNGSRVAHGSDVILKCARRYIPVEVTVSCSYGKWKTADGNFPSCELASCEVPKITNGKFYDKNGGKFNETEVLHGSDVTLKCDKSYIPEEVTIPCSLRKWKTDDGKLPKCTYASCVIPKITNGKFYVKNGGEFKETEVLHGSDVTLKCDKSYIPEEVTIPCSLRKWTTDDGKLPKCTYASCVVPKVTNGKFYYKNGGDFNETEVLHGSDITLKCAKGHVPEEVTIPCSLRKWKTADEKMPKCTLVECPAPTVIQTSYSPRKDKYIFGDRVRVNYCKGNLAFEGSRRLECLKTGKWSDSAECKPFCSHGEDFKLMKNKAFKRTVRHRNFGIGSYAGCKRACKNYKRFLCLSFVYGTEQWKHYCRLYRWNAEDFPDKLEDKLFWTVGVRTCASKKP